MTENELAEILTKYKAVAIVGLSKDPSKDSHHVAEYLKNHGFHIIPINPTIDRILGEKSYKSLLEMPPEIQKIIEIVDVFRPSEEVLPIIEQAVQLKKLYGFPFVVWMQLGIINTQAAEIARKGGLKVVMDKCMMQQHHRLFASNEKQ